MRRLAALLALVRWQNALIAAAGVLVGAWWAWGALPGGPGGGAALTRTLVAAAVAALLTAFANSDNDARDVEIDRVAHPERPLPSGRLSVRAARGVAAGAALAALLLSFGLGPGLALTTWGVILVMWAYSRRLKASGLAGNVVVAVLASLPFLYGAWSVGRPLAALPLLAVAAPLHLAREIAKDLDDAEGDAPARRTLPVAFGARAARAALVVALLLFGAAAAPFALRRPPFAAWLAPALVLCALAARRALSGRRGGPLLFKTAMLAAMAALVVAFR